MNKNEPEIEAPDPEDMFNDTRMSFGDHLEELRTHLFRAIKGFVIGMVISVAFFGQIVMRVIVKPVEDQLEAFENRKADKDIVEARDRAKAAGVVMPSVQLNIRIANKEKFLADLGLAPKREAKDVEILEPTIRRIEDILKLFDDITPPNDLPGININTVHFVADIPMQDLSEKMTKEMVRIRRPRLSTMHITEAFFVWLKVAMMTGLVLSSPWVFYQIWMFIAAGLYPQEKKLVHVYLPFSLFLFLLGVLMCQFFVMPRAIETMLWFNEWLGLSADLRLNEWLGFALLMPIVFGVSFQTPLVMMFIHKIGAVTVDMFRGYRKVAWFLMAVFAAVILPTPDAISMILMWLPMGALYELGILLCVYQGEPEPLLGNWDTEEQSHELIEV